MNTTPTFRDVEQLSALLDGTLSQGDVARLSARLERDSDLRQLYEELSQTRALLRKLPQRRAPRNFTLKRENVRVRAPLPSLFPTFRLASGLATLLFVFSMAINGLGMATNLAYSTGGRGGGGDDTAAMPAEAPMAEATEAPLEMAPAMAEPEATQAPEEMAVPAATEASETLAAEAGAEPTAALDVANAPPEEGDPAAKSIPTDDPAAQIPAPPPSEPPAAPIIPPMLTTGFLTLALVFGAGAALMYWNTNRKRF